jgi:hypothetical protein
MWIKNNSFALIIIVLLFCGWLDLDQEQFELIIHFIQGEQVWVKQSCSKSKKNNKGQGLHAAILNL